MARGALLVGLLAILLVVGAGVQNLRKEAPVVYEGLHYASHGDNSFYGDIAATSISRIPGIRGAVVSHHLLMADDIAKTFAAMGDTAVETVVIVGPDHFRAGPGIVAVSRFPYETPWGIVEPALPFIDALIREGVATQDEYVFEAEHSISSLVAYVKYHFPNAKIVPIVLQRNVAPEVSAMIGRYLAAQLPLHSIVIASVDFSHHLDATAADFHDAKSIEAIRAFDFASLSRLEIDSPASIAVLLRYVSDVGARHALSFFNTNSSRFLGLPDSDDVTSYLFATFGAGDEEDRGAVSVLAVGDVMLGRSVGKAYDKGVDFFGRFRGVEGNFLRGFDMFIANLEGPITDTDSCQHKEIVFKFDPSVAKYLKRNGVTHVNLSNNHSFDCFSLGLEDTVRHLDAAGIRHMGGGPLAESTRTEVVHGKRIAIFGIDRTIAPVDPELVYAHLSLLEEDHDYTLVEVHWGLEYEKTESALQKEFAHGLVDHGADAIIGHHPHVVQPIEVYKQRPIFYSLGNFIFDQIGREVNTGIATGLVFTEGAIQGFVFPYANTNYQPGLMPYQEAQDFCKTIVPQSVRDVENDCVFNVRF